MWALLDNGPIFVFTHDYGVVLFCLTPLWSQSGLVRCPYSVKWFLFNRRTARPGHEYGASPAIVQHRLLSFQCRHFLSHLASNYCVSHPLLGTIHAFKMIKKINQKSSSQLTRVKILSQRSWRGVLYWHYNSDLLETKADPQIRHNGETELNCEENTFRTSPVKRNKQLAPPLPYKAGPAFHIHHRMSR